MRIRRRFLHLSTAAAALSILPVVGRARDSLRREINLSLPVESAEHGS
jgi:hypothetical protein